jgi:two-component system, NtrC family, sensor kinase
VLDKITQQSFRAAEIANGLLNFSRTSTTEFRETDLNQVIRDTLSLLEHQFKTAQIIVDLDLGRRAAPIHGNPGKLQQVFLNLLLNAKEAMPGGGRLRVATLVNGHVEAALVSDSGSGIAPEHLKRIYDPFFTTKTMPPSPATAAAPAWASPSPTASSRSTPARFMSKAPSAPAQPFISSFPC